jgi:hypothetical protein
MGGCKNPLVYLMIQNEFENKSKHSHVVESDPNSPQTCQNKSAGCFNRVFKKSRCVENQDQTKV